MMGRRSNLQPIEGRDAGHSEKAARKALESLTQRPLTDTQWQRARTALLEFVNVLRDWRRQAEVKAESSTASNVTTIAEAKGAALDKAA